MKKIEIKNNKLVNILKDRAVINNNIHSINEKLIKLDNDRKKEGYKMEKLKDRTKDIMDKQDIPCEEFEFISKVYLEKDKAYCEINDMVEDYKILVREERKKKEKEALKK